MNKKFFPLYETRILHILYPFTVSAPYKNANFIFSKLPAGAKIQIVDETSNQRVNATSLLGVISTIEWKETYVESAEDIYDSIKQFIPVTNLTN